jgi:hypothetical protein
MLRQTNLLLNGGNPLRATNSYANETSEFEATRNCTALKRVVSRQKCRDLPDTKDIAISQIAEIAWFQPLARGLHSL